MFQEVVRELIVIWAIRSSYKDSVFLYQLSFGYLCAGLNVCCEGGRRFEKRAELKKSQKRDKKRKKISDDPTLSINMIRKAVKTP